METTTVYVFPDGHRETLVGGPPRSLGTYGGVRYQVRYLRHRSGESDVAFLDPLENGEPPLVLIVATTATKSPLTIAEAAELADRCAAAVGGIAGSHSTVVAQELEQFVSGPIGGLRVTLSPSDESALLVVIESWLHEVGKPALPRRVMDLRTALFAETQDRRE
jgi:hypothetical protein